MSHSTARSQIAILGGGIPGMVTAYRLARLLDAEIFLIEESENLGGSSLWFEKDGEFIDSRPRLWTSDDQNLLDFFEAAGVEATIEWSENRFGFLADGVRHPFCSRSEWTGCELWGPMHRMPLFFAHGSVRNPSKGHAIWKKSTERWLKSIFGVAISEKLILPLLKSRFGGAALDGSAGAAHDWLRTTLTETPQGILEKGSKSLVDSFEKKLVELGVKIFKNERVTALRASDEGGILITTSDDDSENFDNVISTLDPSDLVGIAEPELIEGFNLKGEFIYRGAVCAACFLRQPLGGGGRTSVLGSDAEFDEIYEVPGKRGEEGLHLVYLTRYCRSDSELLEENEALIAGRWAHQLSELYAELEISSSDFVAVKIAKFPRLEVVRGSDYEAKKPGRTVAGRSLFLVNPALIFPGSPNGNAMKKLAFEVADLVALNVREQEVERKINSALGREK